MTYFTLYNTRKLGKNQQPIPIKIGPTGVILIPGYLIPDLVLKKNTGDSIRQELPVSLSH